MVRPREILRDVALFPARTPTLPPATHTNSYALGERDVLLVEPATPYDDERRAWVEWARALVTSDRRVVGILATHHHEDHIGGAEFLGRSLALPLYAHAETWARLPAREGLVWRPLADGESLVLDGVVPQRWQVLVTPGHAPGHVCLFDDDARTLVVGDMVANGSTILIPPDDDGDMAIYLDQLRRLAALGAATLLPAHGEPIDDPAAVLAHYVAHRLMREEKIAAALAERTHTLGRPPTLLELLPRAYDDAPTHVWPIAMLSLRAHLKKLGREGRAPALS